MCSSRGGVSSCPLGAGGALMLPLFGCVPSLSPCLLPAFLLCLTALPFKYALISRFKGVLEGFGAFVGVCVAWCFALIVGLLCA